MPRWRQLPIVIVSLKSTALLHTPRPTRIPSEVVLEMKYSLLEIKFIVSMQSVSRKREQEEEEEEEGGVCLT